MVWGLFIEFCTTSFNLSNTGCSVGTDINCLFVHGILGIDRHQNVCNHIHFDISFP